MHLNTYQDKMLSNSAELQRHIFLAKVEDSKKTMHYTGKNKLFNAEVVKYARLVI